MDNSFRKPRRREYLTAEEIERLLAASKSASRNPVRDYCMLLLMFRHGLRVSELCSIKLSGDAEEIETILRAGFIDNTKRKDTGQLGVYVADSPGATSSPKEGLLEITLLAPIDTSRWRLVFSG